MTPRVVFQVMFAVIAVVAFVAYFVDGDFRMALVGALALIVSLLYEILATLERRA